MIDARCVSTDEILDICNTYTECFILKSSTKVYRVSLNLSKIKEAERVTEIKNILHYDEYKYFETLKYRRRINSFLLGRYSAKKAISALIGEGNLKKILIKNGIINQPVVVCEYCSNIQVSLTHCNNLAAAVAYDDMLVLGIDIENNNQQVNEVAGTGLTEHEKELAYRIPSLYKGFPATIWTIKESLSKALKTGLTIPFNILEVNSIDVCDGYYSSTFSNFAQYNSISFIVGDCICSITYPKNVEIDMDIKRIKRSLYNFYDHS